MQSGIDHTGVVSVSRPTSRCCELNSRANHKCPSQDHLSELIRDLWQFAMKNLEQIVSICSCRLLCGKVPEWSTKFHGMQMQSPAPRDCRWAWESFTQNGSQHWKQCERSRIGIVGCLELCITRRVYKGKVDKSWKHLRHSDSVVESWKFHQISGKHWCQIFCGEECLGSEPRSRRWPQIADIKDPKRLVGDEGRTQKMFF